MLVLGQIMPLLAALNKVWLLLTEATKKLARKRREKNEKKNR
jgi:hypothetical protein